MSYLNKINIKFKKKKRVGRGIGSGLGKTAGRGHKGQKSRSGYTKDFLFEGGQTPLNRRLPKFGFKSKKKNCISIKSNQLTKLTDLSLNISLLKKKKIIKNYIKSVKIVYSKNTQNFKIQDKNIKISQKLKNFLNGGGGS